MLYLYLAVIHQHIVLTCILFFLFFFIPTVKNGGTLTHTEADFKRANYFFCDGMKDPWLNELRRLEKEKKKLCVVH